jgi:AICAR transformylase/IMP cyclohydrolase PurH
VMAEHGIAPIDLVVVNLYPFEATVARPDCIRDDAIENIDIGGPAMVRSAAKNHADVAGGGGPGRLPAAAGRLAETGGTSLALRRELAVKAFRHTARYDAMVAAYLGADEMLPDSLTLSVRQARWTCATARTRISRPPSTARCAPAPRQPAPLPR